MKSTGPELDVLTHRLTECPMEFYQLPIVNGPHRPGDAESINIVAIVSDHFRDLQCDLAALRSAIQHIAQADAGHQRLVAIAIWLLRDPWFLARPELAAKIGRLLGAGLRQLSETIRPELTVTDPDRREEMARLCLRELGFRPAGETVSQAKDRLNTLDSVERVRVVSKTRDAEARARKIREEMARRRAEEAAARYSPE